MFQCGETPEHEFRREFTSVAEAVDAARREFVRADGPLVLLNRVEESAADCPYRRPTRIYACLVALHRVAEHWRRNNGALGNQGWRAALEREGIEYRARISQTGSPSASSARSRAPTSRWTACWAAGWCLPRPFWSAAIRG